MQTSTSQEFIVTTHPNTGFQARGRKRDSFIYIVNFKSVMCVFVCQFFFFLFFYLFVFIHHRFNFFFGVLIFALHFLINNRQIGITVQFIISFIHSFSHLFVLICGFFTSRQLMLFCLSIPLSSSVISFPASSSLSSLSLSPSNRPYNIFIISTIIITIIIIIPQSL